MDKKLIHLKDGGILLYHKRKMKCTAMNVGFCIDEELRSKYPEPTAHFCEHILFEGTKNLTKEQFAKKQLDILPSLNAYTSINMMFVDVFRSNKLIKEAFALTSDMLLNPKISAKAVESQKGVIKQELVRKNSRSDSQFCIAKWRTIRDHYNLSTQVLGSKEEIDAMDAKTLKKFHKEMCVRQNFVCSIVTHMPLFKVKKLVNTYFVDKLPSNPSLRYEKCRLQEKYNFEKPGNMNIEYFPIEKVTGHIIFNLGECDEKDVPAGGMLARILSNAHSGDYCATLRNKGLVYSAGAGCGCDNYDNHFVFRFNCSKENVNKVIDVIAGLLKKRRKVLYDEELIESIQSRLDYESDEMPIVYHSRARILLDEYLDVGTKFFKKKERVRRRKIYKSLTSEDIRAFIQKHFSTPENVYVVIQTDDKNPDFYTYDEIVKKLM